LCEIKGGGQEMAVMVWVDGKFFLITAIQVKLYCLVPASLGISTKFARIVAIKIFAINLYHFDRPP